MIDDLINRSNWQKQYNTKNLSTAISQKSYVRCGWNLRIKFSLPFSLQKTYFNLKQNNFILSFYTTISFSPILGCSLTLPPL